MERWAEVIGFENYAVSDQGRIRNIDTGRILKPCYNYAGHESWYGQLTLMRNGKYYQRYINRLVAIAFCEGYSLGLEVNHEDGDKTNAAAHNLTWIACSENMDRAYQTELLKVTNKDKRKALEIIETGERFESLTECAEYLEVSKVSICKQLKGKLPHVKGFMFRYIR